MLYYHIIDTICSTMGIKKEFQELDFFSGNSSTKKLEKMFLTIVASFLTEEKVLNLTHRRAYYCHEVIIMVIEDVDVSDDCGYVAYYCCVVVT